VVRSPLREEKAVAIDIEFEWQAVFNESGGKEVKVFGDLKPAEVDEPAEKEPDKLKRIVVLEARAKQQCLVAATSQRRTTRPNTETRQHDRLHPKKGSLPGDEIDRLIAVTPTHPAVEKA
jgi:hypothetical protein